MDHIGGRARGRARVGPCRVRRQAARTPPPESFPVDIISDTEFSQITKGMQHAPKAETPKPLVEKIAEAKPVENPTAKVAEKPRSSDRRQLAAEARAGAEEARAEAATPAAEARAEAGHAKEPEPKVDPIAEALKKDAKPERSREEGRDADAAEEARAAEAAAEVRCQPDRGAARQARAAAAGRDRRHAEPRRQRSARRPGTPATLSQNEIDALRARIRQCWNPPAGLADARDLIVIVRIQFKQDGSLAAEPR